MAAAVAVPSCGADADATALTTTLFSSGLVGDSATANVLQKHRMARHVIRAERH